MILEVFRVKPPTYARKILHRQESEASQSINALIDVGEAHQDDKKRVYYHIIFPDVNPEDARRRWTRENHPNRKGKKNSLATISKAKMRTRYAYAGSK
jgi:hypothetical protein